MFARVRDDIILYEMEDKNNTLLVLNHRGVCYYRQKPEAMAYATECL
jgi:hypothetical protein